LFKANQPSNGRKILKVIKAETRAADDPKTLTAGSKVTKEEVKNNSTKGKKNK